MERIKTENPDPEKSGVEIDKVVYDEMKEAIRTSLRKTGKLNFKTLLKSVKELTDTFDGDIEYYLRTVLLDLEATGEVVKEPDSEPAIYKGDGIDE